MGGRERSEQIDSLGFAPGKQSDRSKATEAPKKTKRIVYYSIKLWYNNKRRKGQDTDTAEERGEDDTWRDQHPSKARKTTAHHSNRGNTASQERNPTSSRQGKNSRGKPPRRGKPPAPADNPTPPTNQTGRAKQRETTHSHHITFHTPHT